MFAIALILAAQVTGTIVIDDAPLPGSVVTLAAPDFERATVSNENGHYIFYAVPPGVYDFTVELPGLKTVKRTVAVVDGKNALPQEELELDPDIAEITVVTCQGYRVRDEAMLRTAAEYPHFRTLGNEVTEDLEAWCLARRLDPLEILAAAADARRR